MVNDGERGRQLVDLDTPVKNTNLTLGDFDTTELGYLSDNFQDSWCEFAVCDNSTGQVTSLTFSREDLYCSYFASKCGQKPSECSIYLSIVFEDYSNFVYSGCLNYPVPLEQSFAPRA
mmetsp:Transcript_27468/g.65970  ORF Transcript_27468/g.65970 Transcript_27468/m.65970 type:complete len:118 (+) Transcript_27468:5508-5861(+)